jgi:hypothetical protein
VQLPKGAVVAFNLTNSAVGTSSQLKARVAPSASNMNSVLIRLSFCSSIPDALSLARPYFDKLHRNNKRVERMHRWHCILTVLCCPTFGLGAACVDCYSVIAEKRRINSSQHAIKQLLDHFALVEDLWGLSPAYLA